MPPKEGPFYEGFQEQDEDDTEIYEFETPWFAESVEEAQDPDMYDVDGFQHHY